MKKVAKILEKAVSEVGYWWTWDAELPHSIQLLFGGVLLWNPPSIDEKAPNQHFALRFYSPKWIAFLAGDQLLMEQGIHWADTLSKRKMEGIGIENSYCVINDAEMVTQIVKEAAHVDFIHGSPEAFESDKKKEWTMAFYNGYGGCAISAKKIELIGTEGIIPLEDIPARHQQWWTYWEMYWQKRESKEPMPYDYFCEITIPLK